MEMDAASDLTLKMLYNESVTRFVMAGLDNATEDARHLISGVLGLSLTAIVTDGARPIMDGERSAIEAAVGRRVKREPVYRILGAREFYGLDFLLAPETLEPRPDTEILVDQCLPYLRRAVRQNGHARFADLGTGTGAIAIALLKHCEGAEGVATDIADGALDAARTNALMNGVATRLKTAKGSWFDAVEGRFDMIVSNPPYIGTAELAKLQPEVREFDPVVALDGGIDGLDAYRAIAAGIATYLTDNGVVALEIGFDQKSSVSTVFQAAGFELIEAAKDFGGNDRVAIFNWSG